MLLEQGNSPDGDCSPFLWKQVLLWIYEYDKKQMVESGNMLPVGL